MHLKPECVRGSDVQGHGHPQGRVKPMSGLLLTYVTKTGAKLALGEYSEADVLVEGPVPRDMAERGQRQPCHAARARPGPYLLDQCPANPPALVFRCDAQLLNVGRFVDLVHQHVADRFIVRSDSDPGPAAFHIASQLLGGGWLLVSDMVKPVLPKALARGPLDLAQYRKVVVAGRTDMDGGHLPSLLDCDQASCTMGATLIYPHIVVFGFDDYTVGGAGVPHPRHPAMEVRRERARGARWPRRASSSPGGGGFAGAAPAPPSGWVRTHWAAELGACVGWGERP